MTEVNKVVEKFLNKKQGQFFSFDKEVDLRLIKSKIFKCIEQTKAVDRFINQLHKHIEINIGKDNNLTRKITKFSKDRKAINKVVRCKAFEKLSELKKQGDVEWLNQ